MRRNPRRLNAEVNAGSMADIAFLLLIFFLVATKIGEDQGIMVKLPPYINTPPVELPENRVFSVMVNANNDILLEGLPSSIEEVKEKAKYFIFNPDGKSNLPSTPKKAVISLQNDRGTTYTTYLNVYNELKAAYNELWDENANKRFAKSYVELTKSQQKIIRNEIPLIISEAEPTNHNQSK